jgi:hypothetical protein
MLKPCLLAVKAAAQLACAICPLRGDGCEYGPQVQVAAEFTLPPPYQGGQLAVGLVCLSRAVMAVACSIGFRDSRGQPPTWAGDLCEAAEKAA